MSTAYDAIRDQQENYFLLHGSRRDVTVVKDGRIFPALFDSSYLRDNKDKGNHMQQKRVPHLTCFTDNIGNLEQHDVLQVWNRYAGVGTPKEYKVSRTTEDETNETYQGEIWLVKA